MSDACVFKMKGSCLLLFIIINITIIITFAVHFFGTTCDWEAKSRSNCIPLLLNEACSDWRTKVVSPL